MRFWTRTVILRSVGHDDIWMMITLIVFTIFTISLTILSFLNEGKVTMSGSMITRVTNLLLVSETSYVLTMIALKISLCLFFLRIMINKTQRRAVYVVMFLSTLIGIAFFFFIIFQCGTPVEARLYWQRRILNQCVPPKSVLAMSYSHSAITTATDLCLAIVPIPMIMRSQIRKDEKWVVSSILVVASLGCLASGLRIYWLKALAANSFDALKDMQLVGIWSVVEAGFGILAACLATLRPLLISFVRRYKAQKSGKPHSGRHWIFGFHSSSDYHTNSTSSNQSTQNSRNRAMMFITPELPDIKKHGKNPQNFFNTTSTTNDIPIQRPKQTFASYNPTPRLPVEDGWSQGASSDEKTILYSVFDDLEQPKDSYISTSPSPGRTSPPQRGPSPQDSRVSPDIAWHGREARRSSRATWWPVPQALAVEDDSPIDIEKKRKIGYNV